MLSIYLTFSMDFNACLLMFSATFNSSYCGSPRQAIKFDTRIITLEDTKTSPRPSGFKIYKYCNNEFTRTFMSMKNITTIRTLFEMVVHLAWILMLVCWCLVPLSTILQLYRGSLWWRRPEDPEKTTVLL
jgi:hypothetical protein